MYNSVNNGELFLSVRDAAAALSVWPNTALKGLLELESHGFIKPQQKGAFSLKSRHSTTWILTEFPYRDALPTKDFMRWKAPENQKPVSKFETDGLKNCDRGTPKRAA
jgi:hypothetical protein